MPIITKPSPLEKDATGVFSLDKTALALHPIVVASSHFSSPNVWDKIIVKYKSETLGQFESIEFDASLASPEGQFFVSETAEDIFEVEKITIIDKDGAILLIPRTELTVAEFDIDFSVVAPELPAFDGAANSAYISFPTSSSAIRLQPSVNVDGSGLTNFWMSTPIPGDFTYTVTVRAGLASDPVIQALFGITDSIPSTTPYGVKQPGYGIVFSHANRTAYMWDISQENQVAWTAGSSYNVEIKRISGVVSYKVGNTTFPYQLTTSATLYIAGSMQVGSWEFTNAQLVIPEAPQIGNPIIWDTFLSGAIAEADGGISGGAGNNMIKSNASKVLNGADFKVTYNFTMTSGSDDSNLVHGIMNSTSDTGFAGLTGITYQSSNDILIYDNYSGSGSPQATFSNSMMNQNGSNTAIFEKVGSVLTIKMNDVTIYTKNNHTEQTMVPAVRTWAIQAIDSGYVL